MRTQICRFIRSGPSVNCLTSQQQQKNSSILFLLLPSISTSKKSIPRMNPDKLPGLHIGFGFQREAHPRPASLYLNLGVLEWGSDQIRRFSYQATGPEKNAPPDRAPNQNGFRDVEPKECPKSSNLWRRIACLFGSIITFWWGKQTDILKIKGDLEKVAESVDDVAEMVENVATITEEISKGVAEKFPQEGKIKAAALVVEHLSEEVIEDAQKTRKFIDKLTKAENTAETGIVTAIEALEGLLPDHHAADTAHDGHTENKSGEIN